jgi:hypothetical protein
VPFSDTLTRLFREIFSIHARIVLSQGDSAHHNAWLFTYFNASKERSFYINDIFSNFRKKSFKENHFS